MSKREQIDAFQTYMSDIGEIMGRDGVALLAMVGLVGEVNRVAREVNESNWAESRAQLQAMRGAIGRWAEDFSDPQRVAEAVRDIAGAYGEGIDTFLKAD